MFLTSSVQIFYPKRQNAVTEKKIDVNFYFHPYLIGTSKKVHTKKGS